MYISTKSQMITFHHTCTSSVPCFQISQPPRASMDASSYPDIQVTVDHFDQLLQTSDNDWDAVLGSAREFIAYLETASFFDDPIRHEQQIRTIEVLQRLAYHDVDAGGVADLAELCLERWLQLHHLYPDNVAISKGDVCSTNLFNQLTRSRHRTVVVIKSAAMSLENTCH